MARSAARRPRETGAVAVLRRNPAFARVYAAQLISFGGDWFAAVALQGLVLDLTGSAALAGLMFALNVLPLAIVSPVAGAVVDRIDRRAVMIAADLIRCVLALGFLFAGSPSTLWIAFVCEAGISTMAAFFDPASSAALPNLVRKEDLPTANALMGSAWGVMLAIGAALGGVVAVTLGRQAAFIGDAASFAISALLLLRVRARFHAEDRPLRAPTTLWADIAELFRFARADARVSTLLMVKAGFGMTAGVIALISVMSVKVFDAGDGGTALMMSTRGLGALAGPFLFQRLLGSHDRGLFRGIAAAFAVFGAGYLLFGLAPALWIAALGTMIAHVGGGAQWVLSSIGLQRFSPDHIRGRVFGADYSLLSITMGASLIGAGALAQHFSPRMVAAGLATASLLWTASWTLATRRSWPAA